MAAYVVTQSGEILEYPNVYFVEWLVDRIRLWKARDKKDWVADVPLTFIVGYGRPLAHGTSTDVAALKRALRNYDARTGRWRD